MKVAGIAKEFEAAAETVGPESDEEDLHWATALPSPPPPVAPEDRSTSPTSPTSAATEMLQHWESHSPPVHGICIHYALPPPSARNITAPPLLVSVAKESEEFEEIAWSESEGDDDEEDIHLASALLATSLMPPPPHATALAAGLKRTCKSGVHGVAWEVDVKRFDKRDTLMVSPEIDLWVGDQSHPIS